MEEWQEKVRELEKQMNAMDEDCQRRLHEAELDWKSKIESLKQEKRGTANKLSTVQLCIIALTRVFHVRSERMGYERPTWMQEGAIRSFF